MANPTMNTSNGLPKPKTNTQLTTRIEKVLKAVHGEGDYYRGVDTIEVGYTDDGASIVWIVKYKNGVVISDKLDISQTEYLGLSVGFYAGFAQRRDRNLIMAFMMLSQVAQEIAISTGDLAEKDLSVIKRFIEARLTYPGSGIILSLVRNWLKRKETKDGTPNNSSKLDTQNQHPVEVVQPSEQP